jgi:hypothetical protein
MNYWRITKYNPIYRNAKDEFIKNEWTSYWDIGKIYQNSALTIKEYLLVENKYINAIICFMNYLEIKSFRITGLEKYDNLSFFHDNMSKKMEMFFKTLQDDSLIKKDTIAYISRLVLREYIWCKLESPVMFIHFGYDYYMYIGCSIECKSIIDEIRESGLFIETFQSPYI